MTRKHYVMLAEAIKQAKSITSAEKHNGIQNAALCIADALSEDNARFDRQRFMKASGFEGVI